MDPLFNPLNLRAGKFEYVAPLWNEEPVGDLTPDVLIVFTYREDPFSHPSRLSSSLCEFRHDPVAEVRLGHGGKPQNIQHQGAPLAS